MRCIGIYPDTLLYVMFTCQRESVKCENCMIGYLVEASNETFAVKCFLTKIPHEEYILLAYIYDSPGTFSVMSTCDPEFRLHWQIESFPLQHPRSICKSLLHTPRPEKHSLGVVDPEEIRIQHSLHQPCNPSYLVHISLREVPIEPIGNI